jgi:RNA polymerase primary sigma factor
MTELNQIEINERTKAVDAALKTLSDRERFAVEQRCFCDNPYSEIGAGLSVTASRARAITLRALRKLRHPTRLEKILEAT